MLAREVEILGRLRHKHVVGLLGVCPEERGSGFSLLMVFEFAENGSLWSRIHQRPPQRLESTLRMRWARQLAEGMSYLHAVGVVHRDLKSPNVLLDADQIKICDFGVSQALGETMIQTIVGTPGWTAPEVLRGLPSSSAADVYSYGVILWELVLRQPPFEGMTAMQIIGFAMTNEDSFSLLALPDGSFDSDFESLAICIRSIFVAPNKRPTFDKLCKSLNSDHQSHGESELVALVGEST